MKEGLPLYRSFMGQGGERGKRGEGLFNGESWFFVEEVRYYFMLRGAKGGGGGC